MTPEEVKRCIEQSFGAFSIQKRWQYYIDRDAIAARAAQSQ